MVVGRAGVVLEAWLGQVGFGFWWTCGNAWRCCYRFVPLETCAIALSDENRIDAFDCASNRLQMVISSSDYADPDSSQNNPMRGKDMTWLRVILPLGRPG